jgi:hypothetical protein
MFPMGCGTASQGSAKRPKGLIKNAPSSVYCVGSGNSAPKHTRSLSALEQQFTQLIPTRKRLQRADKRGIRKVIWQVGFSP